MMAFFYKGIPDYYLRKFIAVRDSFDNLENILNLAEIINNCSHTRLPGFDKDSEIVLFTGDYSRVLIKKQDGYFSMALPFQVVDYGLQIAFNLELFEKGIDSEFIAIMRNAISSTKNSKISHEDILTDLVVNFNLDTSDAISYLDAFFHLASEDHGYFRFDDDPNNEDGNFHPRYHFDFFCKNSTAVKIGKDTHADIDCFYSLFDAAQAKWYLRK